MSHFERIYQAACISDETLLQQALSLGASIDEHKREHDILVTPASKLASEGNFPAVKFLKKHGASVNSIVYGLAVGGYFEELEKYQQSYNASLNSIAYGLVIGGHIDKFREYLLNSYVEHDEVAYGLAMGQRFARDLVIDGYCADDDKLMEKYCCMENITVVMALSIGGHIKVIEKLFSSVRRSINTTAHFLAIGGHFGKFEELRQNHGASVHAIAEGLLIGGHFEKLEEYRRNHGARIKSIRHGLHIGGGHFKDRKGAVYALSSMSGKYFRRNMARSVDCPYSYDMKEVLLESDKVWFFRNKVKLDFEQAYAWVTFPKQRDFLLRGDQASAESGLKLYTDLAINTFHMLTGLTPQKTVDLRRKMKNFIYVTGQCKAFNKDKEINLHIQPEKFEDYLEALNTLMQKSHNSSRFDSKRLFFGKNDWQATIRKQALEKAKQYAKSKFDENTEEGKQKRSEFWKKMIKQPIFKDQRRACFLHSWDGRTETVKQIVREEIKSLEPAFTLSSNS